MLFVLSFDLIYIPIWVPDCLRPLFWVDQTGSLELVASRTAVGLLLLLTTSRANLRIPWMDEIHPTHHLRNPGRMISL